VVHIARLKDKPWINAIMYNLNASQCEPLLKEWNCWRFFVGTWRKVYGRTDKKQTAICMYVI